MIGAKVNGRIVPFDYTLQNGDIVDILTSKSAPGPSRDWMNLCKSNSARTKIRQWLKRERRDENILRGKEMFEGEMRRAGITMAYLNDEELVQTCIRKLAVTSLDDMYAAIGYGGITSTRTVNRFRDEIARAAKQDAHKTALDKINEAAERRAAKPVKAVQGVLVEGMDNCLIKFSRCCTPVPGDPIVGFITRGQGISIHRADCPNYLNSLREPDGESRWIHVEWAEKTTGAYTTSLRIFARDRNGLVLDIAQVLNTLAAKVQSLNARRLPEGNAMVHVTMEVPDLAALQLIIARIRTLNSVRQIERGNG
jgi:GTP pyrophosphokinase